jgi:glucose-1-phosphate thymidylyltransferase
MKGIILAAGYATRLYPLTRNKPKPLLTIANVPIIERILLKFYGLDNVDQIYIVTNSKFYSHFDKWLKDYRSRQKDNFEIIIVDDGTRTNETRLGPVGDISLVIEKFNIQEDIIVLAGDNLFELDLKKMCDASKENKASILGVYKYDSLDDVRNKFGVVLVDKKNRICGFEEKPNEPKSTLAATAIYLFRKEVLNYIVTLYKKPYDEEINVGEIIPWLLENNLAVHCEYLSSWIDIGSHEDYENANDPKKFDLHTETMRT